MRLRDRLSDRTASHPDPVISEDPARLNDSSREEGAEVRLTAVRGVEITEIFVKFCEKNNSS